MAVRHKRRALIIVDVQNDFCPGGALTVAHGDEVIEPLNRVAREFLARGNLVIKSRDWHPAQTKHFALYGGAWPIHCVQGTHGARFHSRLIDDPRISIISKDKMDVDEYSAFDRTGLSSLLREEGVDEVWVGGLATDYCVKHTALDAIHEGFKVKAVADAMRPVDVRPGDGERAIEEMRRAGVLFI